MPESAQELGWYAFNLAWLVIVALMGIVIEGVRREIKGLRTDIKNEQRLSKWLVNVVMVIRTRCAMMHPHEPMPEMPPIPEDLE